MRHGASATIVGRDAKGLAESAAALEKATGGKCLAASADVRDTKALKAAVDATVAKFGHIDYVICGKAHSSDCSDTQVPPVTSLSPSQGCPRTRSAPLLRLTLWVERSCAPLTPARHIQHCQGYPPLHPRDQGRVPAHLGYPSLQGHPLPGSRLCCQGCHRRSLAGDCRRGGSPWCPLERRCSWVSIQV